MMNYNMSSWNYMAQYYMELPYNDTNWTVVVINDTLNQRVYVASSETSNSLPDTVAKL